MKSQDKIKKMIKEDEVSFIQLQFINIEGKLQSVEKPITQLDKIIAGEIMIDGSSIKGYSTITTSDLFLIPDWNTYLKLNFLETINGQGVARVICNIKEKDNKAFIGDPRNILAKVEKKWGKKNYELIAAFEAEFFLLKKDENNNYIPADNSGYFGVSPHDTADGIKREMVSVLEEHGFSIEAFHKEVAPGQHEINYKYSGALKAADQIVTFKWIVRTIAHKHNLIATFMPKPFHGINGSGMHTNISVFKDGKNIFARKTNDSINQKHHQFISGLIKHSKEIAAVTNPTVNSYKRLVPGYEAPNCIAWSDSNRTAMFRVPASVGQSTRVEQRNVDPMANPYLALALIFEAGFKGLTNKTKLIKPVYKNLFKMKRAELKKEGVELMPDSLGSALELMSSSKFVESVLGKHTFNNFLKEKYDEWDRYRQIVHRWEIEEYIEY